MNTSVSIWQLLIIVIMIALIVGVRYLMKVLIERERKTLKQKKMMMTKLETSSNVAIEGIDMNEKAVATIDKMRWAVLFGCSVFLYAMFTNHTFQWSLGYVAPSFAVGIVVSAITWMFKRQWKWYDWLNVGSYIGVLLLLANLFLNPLLKNYMSRM